MASSYLRRQAADWAATHPPKAPLPSTPAQRRSDWWHYHRLQVAVAAALLCILAGVGRGLWRQYKNVPDYRVAYVGTHALPEDTARALEAGFAALGQDLDGNGRVTVTLTQYLQDSGDPQADAAAQVLLLGDLVECESYFFLLEDPARFQREQHILCRLDGTLPPQTQDTADGLCLRWGQCPALQAMPLGSYSYALMGQTVSGDSAELAAGLYLARRGFWTDKTAAHPDGCAALWEVLTQEAQI